MVAFLGPIVLVIQPTSQFFFEHIMRVPGKRKLQSGALILMQSQEGVGWVRDGIGNSGRRPSPQHHGPVHLATLVAQRLPSVLRDNQQDKRQCTFFDTICQLQFLYLRSRTPPAHPLCLRIFKPQNTSNWVSVQCELSRITQGAGRTLEQAIDGMPQFVCSPACDQLLL